MDQQTIVDPQTAGRHASYAFNAEILLVAAIITVFLFLVLLMAFHLYARWWLRAGATASLSARVVVIAEDRRTGLDPAVLSALPVFVFSDGTVVETAKKGQNLMECAVCLSEFEEKEIVRLLPGCGHSFHIGCIDMWFHSHSTCPLCRSPVEPAPGLAESSLVAVGVEVAEDPGSSGSGSGLCASCRHSECVRNPGGGDDGTASSSRRGKAVDVRIEVGPSRRAELESELIQCSPVSRLLSFKRLLSMGRRSPRAETSGCWAAELDLEGGLGEPIRVHTPK